MNIIAKIKKQFSPHLTVGEVKRTVCGAKKNCSCYFTEEISVKKCKSADDNTFFVYKLAVPPYCHSAYCVDYDCPIGQVKVKTPDGTGRCEGKYQNRNMCVAIYVRTIHHIYNIIPTAASYRSHSKIVVVTS